MRRSRQLSLFAIAICLAAAPMRAQSAPLVTVDDYRSIADVAVGVTLQAPPDVNQPPMCVHLDLPCLSPQTFTGFGFVLSAGFYPNAFVGIVGESNAYPDDWASYDPGCDRRHSGCALDQTNHVRAALAGVESPNATYHRLVYSRALLRAGHGRASMVGHRSAPARLAARCRLRRLLSERHGDPHRARLSLCGQ